MTRHYPHYRPEWAMSCNELDASQMLDRILVQRAKDLWLALRDFEQLVLAATQLARPACDDLPVIGIISALREVANRLDTLEKLDCLNRWDRAEANEKTEACSENAMDVGGWPLRAKARVRELADAVIGALAKERTE